MTPVQSLYYALGEIVYAIAKSDGKVQREENDKLHQILEEEFSNFPGDPSITEIIFHLLKRDNHKSSVSFEWGLKELKNYEAYLSPELKAHFARVVQRVAEAFPPITSEEKLYLEKFYQTLDRLVPDSVLSLYTKSKEE